MYANDFHLIIRVNAFTLYNKAYNIIRDMLLKN